MGPNPTGWRLPPRRCARTGRTSAENGPGGRVAPTRMPEPKPAFSCRCRWSGAAWRGHRKKRSRTCCPEERFRLSRNQEEPVAPSCSSSLSASFSSSSSLLLLSLFSFLSFLHLMFLVVFVPFLPSATQPVLLPFFLALNLFIVFYLSL